MNRYRTLPWPWAGLLITIALLLQEMALRWFGSAPSLAESAWRVAVLTLGVVSLTLLLLPRRKLSYLLGTLVCAGLMGYALYAQYVLGLEPCPLCVFQRIAVIGCGVVFAVAALHGPGRAGTTAYAVVTALVGGAGALVAMRHLWIQSLPAGEVPACGASLGYMIETLPFAEMLAKVFTGSGECAAVDWRFLGLAMPGWTLVFFVAMIVAAIALIDRE